MKNLLLTCLLIASASVYSHAQDGTLMPRQWGTSLPMMVTTAEPFLRISPSAGTGTPVVTVGTINTAVTSREKVLGYPRLLVQELNCEVTGFSFTLTANGKTFGPVKVKGAVFNDEIKDKIKETEAPPSVKISITDITVKCSGSEETTATPISIEYDH